MRPQYEYKQMLYERQRPQDEAPVKKLNAEGAKGWRVAGVIGGKFLILEREVSVSEGTVAGDAGQYQSE